LKLEGGIFFKTSDLQTLDLENFLKLEGGNFYLDARLTDARLGDFLKLEGGNFFNRLSDCQISDYQFFLTDF
jgi:hypothetical protein